MGWLVLVYTRMFDADNKYLPRDKFLTFRNHKTVPGDNLQQKNVILFEELFTMKMFY